MPTVKCLNKRWNYGFFTESFWSLCYQLKKTNWYGFRRNTFWNQNPIIIINFFYQCFLSRNLITHRTGVIRLYLFHCTTSTRSRTFRHLCAKLCTWDDYHILLIATLVFTRCYSMRFTTLPNHCLLNWWFVVDLSLFACWFD